MISDTYMKVVLTIIAVCLVWICVRDVTLVKDAQASEAEYTSEGYLKVAVYDWSAGRIRTCEVCETN